MTADSKRTKMTKIVYLHGFASGPSSRKARHFRDALERAGATVEVPDLAAGDFERLTITAQLAAVERAAAGGQVSLIGSSMGGYLAALYAARHPETLRVALLAPAFAFARRWAEYLGDARIAEWRREGSMNVFHYGEGRDRRLGFQLLEDASRYEDFPALRQPTLIFHGAHDDVVPRALSEEFAAGNLHTHLEILDSGHELLNVLEYMTPKVTAFLLAADATTETT
jgi:pimeloyl-ACP methyl ester carboxylesterase